MKKELCQEHILSEDYRDFIVSEIQQNAFSEMISKEVCVQKMGTFYQGLYLEKGEADPIQFGRYPYNSIPKCYTLLDTEALFHAGIIQVQNYPTLELRGERILIGFVDTGIDYQNPIFRNLDGSTRIAGIWDQTIQTGRTPEGLFYGSEYTSVQIDAALQSEVPFEIVPSRDENGHGTFLASIAAGGVNEENQFLGAAPEAMIAMVKLKPAKEYLREFFLIQTDAPCYQENDIMLGVTYLNNLAERLGVPLVICIALGTNMGSHSANSPLASQLDTYANIANRAVVIGAGNEANQRHHYLGQIANQTDAQEIELRVAEGVSGFCMELWASVLDVLAISVQSPGGERTYQFPIRNEGTANYRFVLEETLLSVDYKVFVERLDAELIFIRMENPVPGIWKIFAEPIRTETGVFHLWLPVTEFLEEEVYFLQSNPDYTITEPGSTISGMTVGFYNADNNAIAIQSGRGYTRSNRIKPEFAAPGVNVIGAVSGGRFAERTGSSIAAGITAGAAALIMEWVVYHLQQKAIDSTQVRNLLVLGTQKRQNEEYPNREWGYGSLNVYNTFETLRKI